MRWLTSDFDSLSWHDVHVYALRIEEGAHGTGELFLDIDYILEWYRGDPAFSFRVAPATLRFHEITHLRIALDYTTPMAAISPFSLKGIERDMVTFPDGFRSFRWSLSVNWPSGLITFHAPRFTQELAGPEVMTSSQVLDSSERRRNGI